jgi:hypothetical protein
MGTLSVASMIALGSFLATLTFDVAINTAQNWYDVVYADAFWSNRVTDTPALRQLEQEEATINRLFQGTEFEGKQVMLAERPVSGQPRTR